VESSARRDGRRWYGNARGPAPARGESAVEGFICTGTDEREREREREKWLSDARTGSRFSRHVETRARLDDDEGEGEDDDDDDDQICSGIRNRWDGTMGWE
jgi:hypothetical protein